MNNLSPLQITTKAGKAHLRAILQAPETTAERLAELVTDLVEAEPYERGGKKWAARPQAFYAGELGCSVETLRRLIKQPPFVRQQAEVNGKKCTLIRLGIAGAKTDQQVKNILSKIWRNHVDRPRTTRPEFGCICGLLETWPKEHAPEILKLVLDQWPAFMAGAKLEMDALEAKGEGKAKFYKWPSITVIRRFSSVALELWMMEKQAKGQWCPNVSCPL